MMIKDKQNHLRLWMLTLAVVGMSWTGYSQEHLIHIGTGESETIAAVDVSYISVDDPRIADYHVDPDENQIFIYGLAQGRTRLEYQDSDGRHHRIIYVVSPSRPDGPTIEESMAQLKEALDYNGIRGLELKIIGPAIWLRGSLETPSDWEKKNRILSQFPMVNDGTSLHYQVDAAIERRVRDEIHTRMPFSKVDVKVHNGEIRLSGTVYNENDKREVIQIAQQHTFEEVVENINYEKLMVNIRVDFVELTYTKGKRRGNILDFITGTGTAGYDYVDRKNVSREVPTGSGGSTIETLSGLSRTSTLGYAVAFNAIDFLNSFRNEMGDFNNRYTQNVSTLNTEEGKVHVGGTRYIELVTANSVGVEQVDFGVILEIEPSILSTAEIQTKVTVEVSAPLGQNDFSRVRSMQTIVCRNDQSIVITDLIQLVKNNFSSKTPFLSDLPLIGELFKSSRRKTENRELIVLVTPTSPRLFEYEQLPSDRRELLERKKQEEAE
jgi:Flp pilus assembly secretin CpaC